MSDTVKNEAMKDLTRAVMNVMDGWDLKEPEMHKILGLPESVKVRSFQSFRSGTKILPSDQETLHRIRLLIQINDALYTTYPCNPKMAGRWLKSQQRRFKPDLPIHLMLEKGISGLTSVLAELDCTYSWNASGSQAS